MLEEQETAMGDADPFSNKNPESVPIVQTKEKLKEAEQEEKGIPTVNAAERSQTSPDTEKYDKGGKVDPMKLLDRRLAKTPPKRGKGLAAPPEDKRPRPPKNSMKNQGKKKKWEGQA